ncbi:MAG: hypothetical protein JW779_14925, partial [Candidatus Thorarchaeota archaeon]|nr:hypothetical protein [Candidatus Thorarchaeota archaeon]
MTKICEIIPKDRKEKSSRALHLLRQRGHLHAKRLFHYGSHESRSKFIVKERDAKTITEDGMP